jgi:ABC-type bacteriocin/lantibiotic exporter with double-glycine peptidase domain
VLLKVPLVREDDPRLGGVAAARMVERFYQVALSPEAESALLAQSKQGGVSGALLKRAFQRSHYKAVSFSGSIDGASSGLYHCLDQGKPVIALVGAPDDDAHYIVVVGYDRASGDIAFLDPRRGTREARREQFERAWIPARRFTLVAVPGS